MKTLGIVYQHNATVCLIDDGQMVFCQSEERLNRVKNSTGFPALTLQYLYDHVIHPESIDLAVLYEKSIYGYLTLKWSGFAPFRPGIVIDESFFEQGWKKRFLRTDFGIFIQRWRSNRKQRDARLRQEAHSYFSRSLRLPPEKVLYVDHHLAHAYSAAANVQDWGKTLIFTLDGEGDGSCATVNLFERGTFTTLSRNDARNSLGFYYADTTSILGMRAIEDEYKVMGLAPYSHPKGYRRLVEGLRSLLKINVQGNWESVPNEQRRIDVLERLYRCQRFDNIAGALQELTESLITEWVRFWIRRTGCRNVALAGGVFLNVKASQKVAELEEVERIFIVPSAGDESCAIGAAVWASMTHAPGTLVQPLRNLNLGREYGGAEVEKALAETAAASRYEITRPGKINREVGKLLAENKIVARCCGRMEFGARALGNRSILANPSDLRNVHLLNDAIKNRDFWMPFSPSILEEDMPRYVENPKRIEAPYMCLTFKSTPEARRDLIAAMHPRDFTLRPQAVMQEWDRDYYEILRVFEEHTGIGGVLNTSFNLHGEPIVCTPQDAIRTVDRSGLNYLVLGNFLLSKQSEAKE